MKQHGFYPPIKAHYIRIHPWSWYGHISIRAEFYGCAEGMVVLSCLFFFLLHATSNRRFPSWSPLFQSESQCKAFHMEISFIHMQSLVHLHVNKTNFHMKGFAPGLAWNRGETQLGNRLLDIHYFLYGYLDPSAVGICFFEGWGSCVEGKKAVRCAMMCMPVNKKGLYCVVNVVIVWTGELDWISWLNRRWGTEVGVE